MQFRLFHYVIVLYFFVFVVNLEVLLGLANATPIEKGLLVFAGIAFMVSRKASYGVLLIVAVMILITILCASLTTYPYFTADRYERGLLSFVAPWLLLSASPKTADRDVLMTVLAYSPIASVSIGILYDLAGIHQLFRADYLGVARLEGTGSAAAMGTYGYVGFCAALFMWARHRNTYWIFVAIANLTILMLSAARAATALAMIPAAVIYFRYYRHNQISVAATIAFAPAVLALLFVVAGGGLLDRVNSNQLSGREAIWAALESTADAYSSWGIGLGHQITAMPADIQLRAGTMAAHDEYLRLRLELGTLGSYIIWLCLICIFLIVWSSRRVNYHSLYAACVISFLLYCMTDNAISSGVLPFVIVLGSFAFPEEGLESGTIVEGPLEVEADEGPTS